MRVRITLRAGYRPHNGDPMPYGAEVELDDALAVKLVSHGMAEVVRSKPARTATVKPKETTRKPRARKATK